MNLSAKYLTRLLEDNGFIFKRAKGSHQVYYRAGDNNNTVIVPYHGRKDMKLGTFLSILKQAGIDKNSL